MANIKLIMCIVFKSPLLQDRAPRTFGASKFAWELENRLLSSICWLRPAVEVAEITGRPAKAECVIGDLLSYVPQIAN